MIDVFSLTSGLPSHLTKLLTSADRLLAHSNRIVDRSNTLEKISKKNYSIVPSNATIREEHIKCGKAFCLMCPHGPYYYAYWKDDNGKLKKKYIGTQYEKTWRKHVQK